MLPLNVRFAQIKTKIGEGYSLDGVKVWLSRDRELLCSVKDESYCVLAQNIQCFAADKAGVWYVTHNDIRNCDCTVNLFDPGDVFESRRGVLDGVGNFLYEKNDKLYVLDKECNTREVTDVQSIAVLSSVKNGMTALSIAKLTGFIRSAEIAENVIDEGVFKEMLDLHDVVNKLSHENRYGLVSPEAAAELVLGVIALCGRAEIDLQSAIIDLLKKRYSDKMLPKE